MLRSANHPIHRYRVHQVRFGASRSAGVGCQLPHVGVRRQGAFYSSIHTSYSLDAALFDTPAVKGTGYTRPADACDFARYCSALDFWSINDHAEAISPWQWQATREAVRQCDKVGDPDSPDLVSFLGWEWTQGTTRPDPATHYGHKNVIFRDLGEGREPTRPIAAGNDSVWRQMTQAPTLLRGLALLGMSRLNLAGYESVAAHLKSGSEMEYPLQALLVG